MMRLLYAAVLLIQLMILSRSDPGRGADDDMKKGVDLPGAVGSGSFAVVKDWIAAFSSIHPEAELSISSVGSSAAQSALWGDIDCTENRVETICDITEKNKETGDRVKKKKEIGNRVKKKKKKETGDRATDVGQTQTLWGMGDVTFDSDAYRNHSIQGLQQLPALGGSVCPVYSKDVTGNLGSLPISDSDEDFDPDRLNLSFQVLSGIFNGTIIRWDHPLIVSDNPSLTLPSERITVVVRNDKSGESQTFTEAIEYAIPSWHPDAVGIKPIWPLKNLALAYESSAKLRCIDLDEDSDTTPMNLKADGQKGMGIAILRHPFSIGYLGREKLSTLSSYVSQAAISSLSYPDVFVPANNKSIHHTMDGLVDALHPKTLSVNLASQPTPSHGYPISKYLYWYIKTEPGEYTEGCYQAWVLNMFLEWSYTASLAKEIALRHGWIVPPKSVVDLAMKKMARIRCVDVDGVEKGENIPAVVAATVAAELKGTKSARIKPKIIPVSTYTPQSHPSKERKKKHKWHPDVVIGIIVSVVIIILVLGYYRIGFKHKALDTVWNVQMKELEFGDPPEILGRGTFGLVLLAQYRGTQVAVKRVLPPRLLTSASGYEGFSKSSSGELQGREVAQEEATIKQRNSSTVLSFQTAKRKKSYFDDTDNNFEDNDNNDMEAGQTSGTFTQSVVSSFHKKSTWKRRSKKDEYNKLKAKFIVEMRTLSKLRHPCITTFMGAVVGKSEEPILIMEYMDHGSLYDLLHNKTLPLDGDLLLPILQDIAHGLRFLHAADPQVIHGDLKAQNILVDNKFRAKVTDFGLSAKRRVGATGTPLWMAPELLRRESSNTDASDVYSFGVILYEVYSRKEPYEGENIASVLRQVADPKVNKRPPIPPSCPSQVATIMMDCFASDPDGRPSFEGIDLRLKQLDAANVDPGEMNLSSQIRKSLKASRSEKLLFKVFPKHIAEQLRDGGKVQPETKECVTIFFSDIVGFTDICASVTPMKVSLMLDRLYQGFDSLSIKHDVFKIETVGDAYLCATNLVKNQDSDHTKRIAKFAVDAVKVANETLIDLDDPTRGCVQIRVGFHSGPVIANVVGTRVPKYSIFGDTINTASRMESNSLPGRIQCSSRAQELLKKQCPRFPVVPRGYIRIKGKGEMFTYWVNEK